MCPCHETNCQAQTLDFCAPSGQHVLLAKWRLQFRLINGRRVVVCRVNIINIARLLTKQKQQLAKMERQLAELQKKLAASEARAAEEQQLRQEEQRRREAAEASAKESQPTNLTEYLETCHRFSNSIEVVTDKTFTTQGETTNPSGRPFPQRIVPWDEFPSQQEEIWEKLWINKPFTSQRVFPSAHQLDYVHKYLDPISSELGLRHYARETVENPVRTLIEELLRDETLREQFQLQGAVMFESHTNLGEKPNETFVTETMEDMSMTGTNLSKEASTGARGERKQKGKHSTTKGATRRRGGEADQFCIYQLSDGRQAPVVSIEYKAPHKFPLDEIIAGLVGEIRPAEEIINKEGDDFKFLSKSLAAAVITQLFSAMIGKGVQWGYIFTGEAIIFLHIPDDPTMVYYHLSVPRLDFLDDDENRFHRTSVSQIFAFVLAALTIEAPGQRWHDAAAQLDTWAVEYIDILKKIPETSRKAPPQSLYKASRWQGFDRSPIRTRSRPILAVCNTPKDEMHSDRGDESDSSTPSSPTPTSNPHRTTRQRTDKAKPETAQEEEKEKEKETRNREMSYVSGPDKMQTKSEPRIEDRLYCTHQCLLGLAHGGNMDKQCPNLQSHKGKHISQKTFRSLIYNQLAQDRGRGADCKPLYMKGSRGAIFKIRLSSHGYTLLAKGMEESDRHHLLNESKIYHRLRSIQGRYVPVCIGMVDLKLPYYYNSGEYISMLFLSWAGQPLHRFLNRENEIQMLNKADSVFQALRKLQVLQKDPELRNILWDEQDSNLMVIDFERAEVQYRKALATIAGNRKRKRQEDRKGTVQGDAFDIERRRAKGWISQHIRLFCRTG
jgi:hypothetical protein